MKVVFIGAGSGFGAKTVVDLFSFPELRECELVLVDVNQEHLDPVLKYSEKVAEHFGGTANISGALSWRDGVLEGADYVITAFSQGGPGYVGVPYHYEICVPQEYGIYQNVGDTVGIGGVLRTMRTGSELLEIGQEMERVCPGAWLLNYVNPMSMLTRILHHSCPNIHVVGLCHNIQYGIRDIARWIGVSHNELRYEAAGINHMDWFLRLEYLNGDNAYPDLLRAADDRKIWEERPVQFELLRSLGYWTTESSIHCAEYLPYFLHDAKKREQLLIPERKPSAEPPKVANRWTSDSDLMMQLDGRQPLDTERSFEYGVHIVHALETDAVYRMNVNVMNEGLIDNFTDETCVEVCCTADRLGIHPHRVGSLPLHLASLARGMADMQTLASDAFMERDLEKACLACMIDPCTAASASPSDIKACFNQLLELERPWLEPYWGKTLKI